jgi:valyl-tRNA synthetase
MGHMLNNTIQDVLIRRTSQGFNACWVPGTDHASIARQRTKNTKTPTTFFSCTSVGLILGVYGPVP